MGLSGRTCVASLLEPRTYYITRRDQTRRDLTGRGGTSDQLWTIKLSVELTMETVLGTGL